MVCRSWPQVVTFARQSIYFVRKAQFGDGKPVILVPDFSNSLTFLVLSNWLTALGYRPVTTGLFAKVDDSSVANLIRGITQRVGRKAVPLLGSLRATFPKLCHIFGDRVYRGDQLRKAAAKFGRWRIEIVTR